MHMKETIAVLIVSLLGWLCACSDPLAQRAFINREAITARVLVMHDYWHSAILVRTIDVSSQIVPEVRDFSGADFLEFSWGDREYFPHPDPGIALALKAAVWSSGSILHVVGVRGSPELAYPNAEIITIGLTTGNLQRLVQFVAETFSRAGVETASAARPGLSENARFYWAQGRFSIFRTCNTWVAEALQAAELPINPAWVITARSLDRHVRPLGSGQKTAGRPALPIF
jgi:uncharacterized protein (TIGR02117 family)